MKINKELFSIVLIGSLLYALILFGSMSGITAYFLCTPSCTLATATTIQSSTISTKEEGW